MPKFRRFVSQTLPTKVRIRKIRWSVNDNQGKRGGVRVIYYYKVNRSQILLLFAYPKNVADNLTDSQKGILKEIAKEFYNER